jgi:D-tyrosyl-tRNA(Tyr) deacylase
MKSQEQRIKDQSFVNLQNLCNLWMVSCGLEIMRAVLQRVKRAEVRVANEVVGRIGPGLLVLVGVAAGDTPESAAWLAEKTVNLRVFDDPPGRMNESILEADPEIGAGILCVSQFTLYGDCRKGRRPSYDKAAPPETARRLYDLFLNLLRELLSGKQVSVECGQFQAMMDVELVNDGPVTLLLDSEKAF